MVATATVAGVPVKSSHVTRPGDVIVLEDDDTPIADAGEIEAPFIESGATLPPILYEDDQLMVLNKPRGLAVHPARANVRRRWSICYARRATRYRLCGPPDRAGIVHRLDKDTTGLILALQDGHGALEAGGGLRRAARHQDV